MAFISLFHKNLKKGYIHKNVNIITLIIDDFIVLFNFRILKSKGYFRPFTNFLIYIRKSPEEKLQDLSENITV